MPPLAFSLAVPRRDSLLRFPCPHRGGGNRLGLPPTPPTFRKKAARKADSAAKVLQPEARQQPRDGAAGDPSRAGPGRAGWQLKSAASVTTLPTAASNASSPFFPELMGASNYLYSEVIVPKQIDSTDYDGQEAATYLLKIEGVHRFLHLYKISFAFWNMPVYLYGADRIKQVKYSKVKLPLSPSPFQVDCFYQGFVEGVPRSSAVLSNISGLWGYIQLGSLTYEIQPIENSASFQHIIYRKAPRQSDPCLAVNENSTQQTSLEAEDISTEAISKAGLNPEIVPPMTRHFSRYLACLAVCDHSVYQWKKENITELIKVVLQVFSVVHNIYDEIGLHTVLTGIEIWSRPDYLEPSNSFRKKFDAFETYINLEMQHRTHIDHAFLFTTMNLQDPLEKSRNPPCVDGRSSISISKMSPYVTDDGVSAAHQLGHAIGLTHDDLPGKTCQCSIDSEANHCLMHSTKITHYRLSNCSKARYFGFLKRRGQHCFLNLPPDKDLAQEKICGNGVVESGEQCDCGRDERCRRTGCCQFNCQLTYGASCVDGLCCRNCKLLSEGTVCREAISDCDLAEYCSGDSGHCPPDVFKQNGMLCGSGSTCYLGSCIDTEEHCRSFFGPEAKTAPNSCYWAVNQQGDRTGNCGHTESEFAKCSKLDALCGRVHCVNVDKIPRLPSGQAILQTPVGNVLCWSITYHKLHLDDEWAVKDGSLCGSNKICIKRSCVSLNALLDDCDLSKCNNQGICNSKRNCHCTYGWAPPHCSGKGFGGSIDSGPPPEQTNYKRPLVLGSIIGVALLLLALSAMLAKFAPSWIRYGELIRRKMSPEPMDSTFESSGSLEESLEESTEIDASIET